MPEYNVVPNKPDLMVVKHKAIDNTEYLDFYSGMLNNNPTLYKQVNITSLYEDLTGNATGSSSFSSIIFDPNRSGKFWMTIGAAPQWDLNTVGRIVEYDPSSNTFIDITFDTDDITPFSGFPFYLSLTSLNMDRQTGLLYMATSSGVTYWIVQTKFGENFLVMYRTTMVILILYIVGVRYIAQPHIEGYGAQIYTVKMYQLSNGKFMPMRHGIIG